LGRLFYQPNHTQGQWARSLTTPVLIHNMLCEQRTVSDIA
jgi:hypothetical protein